MSTIATGRKLPASIRRLYDSQYSVPFLGIALFAFATAFPPFDTFTDVYLPAHMLQHVLIAASGIMISYPFYRAGKFDRIKSTKIAFLGLVSLSALVIFWHLPTYWDAAVLNFWTHISEHVCFLLVGLLIGITFPMFNNTIKVLIALLAVSGHMFYGFALYVTPTAIYPLYPVSQQAVLGLLLFAPAPVYVVAYLYFSLMRESRRLDRESKEWVPRVNKSRINGRMVVVTLAILLLTSIGVYYGATFAIISQATHSTSPSVATVYIEEGPVYWQYTPQSITVVIGVNNTVDWVSHSFAQDTITSVNGTFNSGPLSPGQTFSYTFSNPGVYRYYCEYHAWMTGAVIVLPQSS